MTPTAAGRSRVDARVYVSYGCDWSCPTQSVVPLPACMTLHYKQVLYVIVHTPAARRNTPAISCDYGSNLMVDTMALAVVHDRSSQRADPPSHFDFMTAPRA